VGVVKTYRQCNKNTKYNLYTTLDDIHIKCLDLITLRAVKPLVEKPWYWKSSAAAPEQHTNFMYGRSNPLGAFPLPATHSTHTSYSLYKLHPTKNTIPSHRLPESDRFFSLCSEKRRIVGLAKDTSASL
jgi:hypothetical protein